MAEACRLGLQHKTEKDNSYKQDENFCVFNVLCVFISLITILADLTTDILVFAEYCKVGQIYWAIPTLILILVPNILINIFSLRWYVIDQKSNLKQWIFHGTLVGFLERYVLFLHKIFACPNLDTHKLMSQRNDLSLLHFLYIFTGTIPQIILQTYAIITLNENFYTKVFALIASIASVICGCAAYLYSIMVYCNNNFQWVSLVMRLLWHFAMLVARLSAIVLFTVIFGVWTLLPLCLHWTAMTFWIIVQNTTFCPNKIEETLYNVVMGFVYCFCYINLRDGHTRYRLMMFYTLMVSQNFGSLFLYVIITDIKQQRNYWSVTATICIIAGTFTGLCAMVLYYRYFHSKGPITWKSPPEDIELNNKTIKSTKLNKNNDLRHVRSFKSSNKIQAETKHSRCEDGKIVKSAPPNDSEIADKKFLLDHWIARSGSPTFTSAPIGNTSINASSIEVYTIENTPQSMISNINKKITICSPTELNLKLSSLENIESSIDEITSSNLHLQKRRGICSSDELRDDIANLSLHACNMINECFDKTLKTEFNSMISQDTDGSNKKTSSDSIDMDLDLSFSDINSSDINTFNENIVQKLCLSALKNIKVGNQDADIENIQRIALDILKEMYTKKDKSKNGFKSNSFSNKQRDVDTPTEILSVHDYENICAVNIAREAWGLRSWNGYCDIENWLHDGSVVRDRRRDTFTSASTEISSCISHDLKQAIMAAPSFSKKNHTYSNVFVKFEKNHQEDYVNATSCLSLDETFLAKPCLIDGKDLSHLEPILEELDDLGDIDPANKKRLNSESSLVATIDEIRKATVTNSPRNVYHRREQLWNSPQSSESSNIHSNLKRALWKEPSKFNSNNTLESLPEKENIVDLQGSKYDMSKKELNFSHGSDTLDLDNPESASIYNKNIVRPPNSSLKSFKSNPKQVNTNSEQNLQDLSNNDIDYLWQLVSENKLPLSSTEDLSSSRRTPSMQSLIHKDTSNATVSNSQIKVTNIKKGSKSRPRRKFSILRERFEPKANSNSDKEVLYQHTQNTLSTPELNVVSLKNELNSKGETSLNVDQHQLINSIASRNTEQNSFSGMQSNLGKNIKEKRTLFMKQVLSPPKFNTKLKHKA